MPRFDVEAIKRYYEHNTSLFLRLGQGVDGTIRRAVWGPGVRSRAEAMAYVDELILEQLSAVAERSERRPRVLDLGCGVGASLCRIARRQPLDGTGVTISPTQVRLAEASVKKLGLSDSVRVLEADFSKLPNELHDFDLAFAIESFVHAPEAQTFFRAAFAALAPGGTLIVCDDFLATEPENLDASAAWWLRRYREGWRANLLLGPRELGEVSARVGFLALGEEDLSGFVELGRPRDRAIALLTRGFGWLPFRSNYGSMLKGGDALQWCLKKGWIHYRICKWQKPEST